MSMSSLPTAATSELRYHTVNRSNELLSCARTALKINQSKLKQRNPQQQQPAPPSELQWLLEIDPASLKLHAAPTQSLDSFGAPISHTDDTPSQLLLKDSTDLLAMLDGQLSELHSLVRRRGHTNDPTIEIQSTLEKFQEGVKEMKEVCASLAQEGNAPVDTYRGHKVSLQRRKHYELLSGHLESLTKERMETLKKELEMRSIVIRDQMTHRKKLLSAGASSSSGSAARRVNVPLQTSSNASNSSAAQFQSPLFTMTASGNVPKGLNGSYGVSNAASAPSSSNGASSQSAYAGYGGYKGSSYGGSVNSSTNNGPAFSTGMRQRKQQQSNTPSHMTIDQGGGDDDDDKYTKDSTLQQIHTRRQNRQTASRLQSARLAEKSIAELTTMFSKMSNLISQQGEVLERIEDDVEAAGGDIDAGHDELVKVYGYTKGNRGLIIKVFAVLIFLIVFMRFYKR